MRIVARQVSLADLLARLDWIKYCGMPLMRDYFKVHGISLPLESGEMLETPSITAY